MLDAVSPLDAAYTAHAFRGVWNDFDGQQHLDIDPWGSQLKERVDGENEDRNGYTFFFRHHLIYTALLNGLEQRNAQRSTRSPVHFLNVPDSIGCDSVSLSAMALHRRFNADAGYTIDTLDISAQFTDIARRGIYPWQGLWNDEDEPEWRKDWITSSKKEDPKRGYFRVRPDVAAPITHLPAQPFQSFTPQKRYDVVVANNLFMYMSPEETAQAMKVIDATGCEILVFAHGDPKRTRLDIHMMPKFNFIPAHRQPQWRQTPLNDKKLPMDDYQVWVRKGSRFGLQGLNCGILRAANHVWMRLL